MDYIKSSWQFGVLNIDSTNLYIKIVIATFDIKKAA